MEMTKKGALDHLLDEITPLEQDKTDAKMMLAVRIADAMKAKKWKNKDLLAAVGRDNPSVITKWLSGTHNFTVDTLVELSKVLEISLLNLEERKEDQKVVYHVLIKREVFVPRSEYFTPMFSFHSQLEKTLYTSYLTQYSLPKS